MARTSSDLKTQSEKPSFTVDRHAQGILHTIEEQLKNLQLMDAPSSADSRFLAAYSQLVGSVDRYHQRVISTSEYTVTCSQGCAACCYHWVEDVNSFEAQIIAEYIKSNHPAAAERIRLQCEADCEELLRLEGLVTEKLTEQQDALKELAIVPDGMDLLLSVFYQMRRPCPLLSHEGSCLVYPVRPLTCRMYVSVSDPLRCDPEYINDAIIPTCIIDFNKKSNALFDALHIQYATGEGENTGLRSQLLQYLS